MKAAALARRLKRWRSLPKLRSIRVPRFELAVRTGSAALRRLGRAQNAIVMLDAQSIASGATGATRDRTRPMFHRPRAGR